jgi:hypothetical protein
MFVRFRQSGRRLALSLLESHRAGDKVRNDHIASLGSLPIEPTVAERMVFWQRFHECLDRLANRLGDDARNRIIADVFARIPLPTLG